MSAVTPGRVMIEARKIARDHGLHLKEKPLRPGLSHWYIYRKLPDGHLTFLGKRGSPEGVRAYVAKLASVS